MNEVPVAPAENPFALAFTAANAWGALRKLQVDDSASWDVSPALCDLLPVESERIRAMLEMYCPDASWL